MDDISSEMPREVEDIITDLSVIAGIPTASKLNVSAGTYTAANSLVGAIYRLLTGERRTVTLDYINDRINKAIQVGRKYPEWIDEIANSVEGISNALVNLEHCYSGDARTIGKINTIKIRIEKKRFKRACEIQRTDPISIHKLQVSPVGSPAKSLEISDDSSVSESPSKTKTE